MLAHGLWIIGAGLGGLATAIALTLAGHSVKVLEQAPELGEVRSKLQRTRQENDS